MEKLVFPARLQGSMDEIKQKIDAIPFYATYLEGGMLTVAKVESRNIHKMPYLFYIIEISAAEITVSYSIPHDVSETMRRATMLRNVSSVVSLISEHYSIDEGRLLQYIDSTLDVLLKELSKPYSTLFNQYNTILNEYRALKRLNLEISASNRNLTVQAEQITEENKKLASELKKLQKYSDESLMVMMQDWIEVHNNTIDINEFAKTYEITPPRAEEILDKMVSLGYLEMVS